MKNITTRQSTGRLDRSRNRRVLRVITRLNIGGPSIQAVALTSRLAEFGYDSRLVHGSLSRGEGDMGYLLEREGGCDRPPRPSACGKAGSGRPRSVAALPVDVLVSSGYRPHAYRKGWRSRTVCGDGL